MASMSLEFRGTSNAQLLWTLAGLVCAAVLVWAVVQWIQGKRRYAAICAAAAFGPITLGLALVIDAAAALAGGRRHRAARSAMGVAALAVPIPVVAGVLRLAGVTIPPDALLRGGLLTLGLAGAIGVFYASVYSSLGTARMAGLLALRFAAVVSLILLLFLPAMSVVDTSDAGKPYLALVVDRSGSMATTDEQNMPERYLRAVQMLQAQRPRIERSFRPVYYHFAREFASAASLGDLTELRPSGQATDGTNLAHAIRSAGADFAPSDLAGIVVLTDGLDNLNPPSDVRIAAVDARVPIYPVAVGSTDETLTGRRNLRIASVDAPTEAVVNNVATLTAHTHIAGFAGRFFTVTLRDTETGDVLATAEATTSKNAQTVPVELQWTPAAAEPGKTSAVRKLAIDIEADPAEADSEDNDHALHVRLSQPRVRVLYVEGSIRPEYRAIKRLLMTDSNIQLLTLIRFDRTRFLAQGSIDGRKLAGLPSTDSDFALFDVIILGDVDASWLNAGDPGRADRIARFVREGGGLLMLGGRNSFGPGGFGRSAIETVLPVRCGSREMPQETTAFVPQVTAAGEIHPILEGINTFFPGPGGREVGQGLPKLPKLNGCVTVPGAKGGSDVLMVHPTRRNEAGPLVALAVAKAVGKGRSGAMTFDTTYLWDRPMRAAGQKTPYPRLWGQLVRWLAGVDAKSRQARSDVLVRLQRTDLQAGERLGIRARVWDPKAARGEQPEVTCRIERLDGRVGRSEDVPMIATKLAGRYEADFTPTTAGRYRVRVEARRPNVEEPLGADQMDVRVTPPSAEMDRLARDDKLLEQLADHSGGRRVLLAGLPDLVDHVTKLQIGRDGPAARAQIVHLYNFPALFVVLVALLTAEWLLRRRWQLQ